MHDFPLITLIAAAFAAAWFFGIITQSMKLSPIVGYLLAGIAIGPHTPGLHGDVQLATQLAEIGVMLLMFGVGLHFQLKDLLSVKRIAIPGAIGQSIIATILGVIVAMAFGGTLKGGLVLGMAMSVASTVVLLRVLMDNNLLDTPHGHVAVGWLIVEDLVTVIVLVLIPALGTGQHGVTENRGVIASLGWAMLKLLMLVLILLFAGSRVVPWIMVQVAPLRSRELFTLTVLVMAVTVAAAAQHLFGASVALGAFLAGMVVGQSAVSSQAAADVLPLRDAFAVLFFASVGMLFDPMFVVHHPFLMLACMMIVLIGKPLAAMIIVALVGYPVRTGVIVALGLAQIGEFSFILSELGKQHGLVSEDGHNVLVACALVSITLNPILMRSAGLVEGALEKLPKFWAFLNRKVKARESALNETTIAAMEKSTTPVAVILGYGPVGKSVDRIIRDRGLETIVIDLNIDTIQSLTKQNRLAIYGDAFNMEVMAQALPRATHLVITLPHSTNRGPLIATAKLVNPALKVFVRARYIREHDELVQVGADQVCYEETEAAVALARMVLHDAGAKGSEIETEIVRIRAELDWLR